MDIQNLIELLHDKNNNKAYQALKELLKISEESDIVYPFFDYFIDMMNNQENSYIRTRGLRLIAYNAKWDVDNKVNLCIHKWLEHIEDEKPITSRQCIKDTVIIAKNKPELIDDILKALEEYHKVYEDSMQNLIFKDRQKVLRQIKQYTW